MVTFATGVSHTPPVLAFKRDQKAQSEGISQHSMRLSRIYEKHTYGRTEGFLWSITSSCTSLKCSSISASRAWLRALSNMCPLLLSVRKLTQWFFSSFFLGEGGEGEGPKNKRRLTLLYKRKPPPVIAPAAPGTWQRVSMERGGDASFTCREH